MSGAMRLNVWRGLAGVLLFLPSLSAAQMTQCQGVAGGTAYKVLVDEVHYASGTAVTPLLPVELVQSTVEGALEKVRRRVLRGAQPGFTYLNCQGRHPAAPSAFSPDLVRSMAANHAILELWGTLFNLAADKYTLDIHYYMFPLASDQESAPLSVAFTKAPIGRRPDPEQVLGAFTRTRADLPIYFSLSAGVQAYLDNRFEEATRLLCEAAVRAKARPDLADLTAYAAQLASKAAQEARKKAPDANGLALLTDAEAQRSCAFATTR